MAKQHTRKNPTRYNKSKYTSAQKDAAYVADGREMVFRFESRFDADLNRMNKSKRGRPFFVFERDDGHDSVYPVHYKLWV